MFVIIQLPAGLVLQVPTIFGNRATSSSIGPIALLCSLHAPSCWMVYCMPASSLIELFGKAVRGWAIYTGKGTKIDSYK